MKSRTLAIANIRTFEAQAWQYAATTQTKVVWTRRVYTAKRSTVDGDKPTGYSAHAGWRSAPICALGGALALQLQEQCVSTTRRQILHWADSVYRLHGCFLLNLSEHATTTRTGCPTRGRWRRRCPVPGCAEARDQEVGLGTGGSLVPERARASGQVWSWSWSSDEAPG